MASITAVREVVPADLAGIVAVHAGAEGPWAEPDTCAIAINHRLSRPFHCRVAERYGEVVGHAEWIISREPELVGPQYYLGMLQVRADCRGQGIGRLMVEHGAQQARRAGCRVLRTLPEEGIEAFYTECGFSHAGAVVGGALEVRPEPLPKAWSIIESVPETVPADLPMRLGWAQACSAHMWEICNRPGPPAGSAMSHPCVRTRGGDAYVQLRFASTDQALVVAWANRGIGWDSLMAAAHALAHAHAISRLYVACNAADHPPDLSIAEETPILERGV